MPIEIVIDGILSDMDGTLVDSTPAVEKTMTEFCLENKIDPEYFFQHSHGVRTRDNIKRFAIGGSELSEEDLIARVTGLEAAIAENGRLLALAGGRGITRLPGVDKFLHDLRSKGARWGIVTSATNAYASSALKTAEIVPPALPFLITAELCHHGKPHPEPYLTGLKALQALPGPPILAENVLVLEDAPSGLASGLAALCQTLAVCTGQTRETVRAVKATHKVVDFERVQVISVVDGKITLRLTTLEEEENLSV